MKGVFKLSVAFLLIWSSSSAHALDQEKFDRLTSLMVKGCSLGQSISFEASASGGISFVKKGVKGEFSSNKSEIPAIIEFLSEDKTKSKQADNTRECMVAYMNKIFDAELGTSATNISKDSPVTIVENGVIYDFEGCHLKGRNDLECKFQVTSSLIDRISSVYSSYSTLFDNASSKYTATGAKMANAKPDRHGVQNVELISDMPTKMSVTFKNVPSNLKSISRLRIHVGSKTEASDWSKNNLEYRDVLVMR